MDISNKNLFSEPADNLINLYSTSGFRPINLIGYVSHYNCSSVFKRFCPRCNRIPDTISLRPYMMCDFCLCRPAQLNCDIMYYKAGRGEIMLCQYCINIVDKNMVRLYHCCPQFTN